MKLIVNIDDAEQSEMNKSISAIRTLRGVRSVEQIGPVKEIITGNVPTGKKPLFG